VRRRIQYAILDEERPGLVRQIAGDWADPDLRLGDDGPAPDLDAHRLAAELDGGLRRLTLAAAKTVPRLVLAGYAERAVANTFDALHLHTLAGHARALQKATHAAEAFEHGLHALKHYLSFRHPRS
jgi:alpha-beta hydrolase superfamily lysophospholipase